MASHMDVGFVTVREKNVVKNVKVLEFYVAWNSNTTSEGSIVAKQTMSPKFLLGLSWGVKICVEEGQEVQLAYKSNFQCHH